MTHGIVQVMIFKDKILKKDKERLRIGGVSTMVLFLHLTGRGGLLPTRIGASFLPTPVHHGIGTLPNEQTDMTENVIFPRT